MKMRYVIVISGCSLQLDSRDDSLKKLIVIASVRGMTGRWRFQFVQRGEGVEGAPLD